ncbi:uncharacterized protein LOC129594097 isoform X2 [Paramacrobiotus metropolitanus]|uniref:uncharacterized protein LOC129594097 isoform X2 n=1 Tax=Paramacrobiotus metropolitanus TaxID=2943436 RepID=UPI0024456377|nr:uncharacterized protein LOC129594097 isoform X2 [Paramacrobiotus metropolitanus]
MAAYAKGDLVFRSRPFVYTLKPELLDCLCYRCLKPLPSIRGNINEQDKENHAILEGEPDRWPVVANSKRAHENTESADEHLCEANRDVPCPHCHIPLYCSPECRELDWFGETPTATDAEKTEEPLVARTGRHRLECSYLRRLRNREEARKAACDFFLMLGVVLKLRSGQNTDVDGDCDPMPEKRRVFSSLLTHSGKMDEDRLECLKRITKLFVDIFPPEDLPSDAELLEIFGALQINCFDIDGLGLGLYLQPSIIDHSCQRNAVFYFDGTTIYIQALEDIPDISQVRISYTELFAPISARQSRFKNGYHFRCQCQLCSNTKQNAELYPVMCNINDCTASIPLDDRLKEPCPHCRQVMSEEEADDRLTSVQRMIRRYLEGLEEIDERMELFGRSALNPADIQWSVEDNLQDCRVIIRKCEKELHTRNMLLGMAYDREGRLLLNRKPRNYEDAFHALKRSIPALRNYFGEKRSDPRVAVQLMLVGMLAFLLGSKWKTDCILFLDEARHMLLECDGSGEIGKKSLLAEVCSLLLKTAESDGISDDTSEPAKEIRNFKVLHVSKMLKNWSACTGDADEVKLFTERMVLVMGDLEQIAHPRWFLL